MAPVTFYMGDEADTACVMFEAGIVEALCLGETESLGMRGGIHGLFS